MAVLYRQLIWISLEHSPLIDELVRISEVGSTQPYQLTMPFQPPAAVVELLSGEMVSEAVTVLPDRSGIRQHRPPWNALSRHDISLATEE